MKTRVALAALLIAGSAHAEFISGNKLFDHLNGEASDRIYAMGYIVGVFDTGRGVVHCPPSGVTVGQVRDMVHNFLRSNPQDRNFSGDSIVNHVLKNVWPCANKPRSGGGTAL